MHWAVVVVVCVLAFVVGLLLFCALFGIIYRKLAGRCCCKTSLLGKTVIITGANSGLGYETAVEVSRRGARVVMACRDVLMAGQAAERITTTTGNQNVVVQELDVSLLSSVRAFAERIKQTEKSLHVLVHNAGVECRHRAETSEGLEVTIATNHFGPALLTSLLSELLGSSAPSRVVMVSSAAHFHASLQLDDLNYRRRYYLGILAYNQSKLCNVLYAKELVRRLPSGVTPVSLHPGHVATSIFRKHFGIPILDKLTHFFVCLLMKGPQLGAQTILHCCVAPEIPNSPGAYYRDCKVTACSTRGSDETLARQLWEATEKVTSVH